MGDDRSYDGDPGGRDGVVRGHYDWESTAPSAAVVEIVAKAERGDPMALEPLYESVDPNALNEVVRSEGVFGFGSVTFAFAGREVTVHGDGDVVVRPIEC